MFLERKIIKLFKLKENNKIWNLNLKMEKKNEPKVSFNKIEVKLIYYNFNLAYYQKK